jgi:hypothetical protein
MLRTNMDTGRLNTHLLTSHSTPALVKDSVSPSVSRGRHWMREVAPVSQTGQPEASLRPSADVARQDYASPMPVPTHRHNPGHYEDQATRH